VAGILKNAWEAFPNRLIPLVTWVLSATAYVLVTKDFTGAGLVEGILTAAMATGVHSGLKNSLETKQKESA
jgi:multisubunit Na+/H+ antiporter MnhE subunit